MSDFKESVSNQTVATQLGPNMQGSGRLMIELLGKPLNIGWTKVGNSQILYGINGANPTLNFPEGQWLNASGLDSIKFSFSSPGAGDDFKLFWNQL